MLRVVYLWFHSPWEDWKNGIGHPAPAAPLRVGEMGFPLAGIIGKGAKFRKSKDSQAV